jgi:hypothetical protein
VRIRVIDREGEREKYMGAVAARAPSDTGLGVNAFVARIQITGVGLSGWCTVVLVAYYVTRVHASCVNDGGSYDTT